jgi:hypothetical protein
MVRHGCQVDVATDPRPLRVIHVNGRERATREIALMQTATDLDRQALQRVRTAEPARLTTAMSEPST